MKKQHKVRHTERFIEIECRGNCGEILFVTKHTSLTHEERIYNEYCVECVPVELVKKRNLFALKKEECLVLEGE